MTEVKPILARLGLSQYLDSFLAEGFDTWETLLDITESDLEALNVKLGHRRKLQRAIADARGHSPDRSLASPSRTPYFDESRSNEPEEKPASIAKPGGRGELGPSGKRKYRRHPKPDENAPARPPSAYVIFSNKIRDDLKDHELSFTEIAKLVGEKWQELSAKEKEPYERQANAAKEQHLAEMAEYKKTQGYQDYLQYLAEFKAKYGGQQGEGKRPRLHPEQSTNSSNAGQSPGGPQGYHWSRVPIAPRISEIEGVNPATSPPSHRGSPSLIPGGSLTASGHASPSSTGSMASGQAPWNVKSAQRHLGLGGGQIPASGSEELQSEPIRIEPGRSVSGEEQPDQQSGSSGPSVSTDSGPSYPWISNIPSRRTLHHPSQPLPSLKGEDTSLSSISSMSSGISAGSTSSMPSRTMLPPLSRIDETNSQRSLPSLAASLSQGHLDQSPSMAHPSSAQQSPVAPYGPYQHTPPSEESTTLPPLASTGPQLRQDHSMSFEDYQSAARLYGGRPAPQQPQPPQHQQQQQQQLPPPPPPPPLPLPAEPGAPESGRDYRRASPTDALLRQPLSRADTSESAS